MATLVVAKPSSELIRKCIKDIELCLGSERFVLIGGGSMVLLGSVRTTRDVDILVSETEMPYVYPALLSAKNANFLTIDGKLYCAQGGVLISLDILTAAVNTVTFEGVLPYTTTLETGVRVPRLDYSLAMKIKCFYLRGDDEHGQEKTYTDIEDVRYLTQLMTKRGEVISDECAKVFQLSFLHMFLLREEVGPEVMRMLLAIGVRKLVLPWKLNSKDQQEYYQELVECPRDPFDDEYRQDE